MPRRLAVDWPLRPAPVKRRSQLRSRRRSIAPVVAAALRSTLLASAAIR